MTELYHCMYEMWVCVQGDKCLCLYLCVSLELIVCVPISLCQLDDIAELSRPISGAPHNTMTNYLRSLSVLFNFFLEFHFRIKCDFLIWVNVLMILSIVWTICSPNSCKHNSVTELCLKLFLFSKVVRNTFCLFISSSMFVPLSHYLRDAVWDRDNGFSDYCLLFLCMVLKLSAKMGQSHCMFVLDRFMIFSHLYVLECV